MDNNGKENILRVDFYQKVVHPIFSIFAPFLFLFVTIVMPFDQAFKFAGGNLFPPAFWIVMLLAGISENISGNLLYKERIAGFGPRLRELIFVIIFGLLLIMILFGDLFTGNFQFTSIVYYIPLAVVCGQWLLSYYIHQKLREREIFLSFFSGKKEKDLKETYQTFIHEGGDVIKNLKSIRKLIIAGMFVNFVIIVLVAWAARIPFTAGNIFLVILYYVVQLFFLSALNGFLETQVILSEGYLVNRNLKRKKNTTMIILLILVMLIMIPITGKHQILPESYLNYFFQWLQSLGRTEMERGDLKPPEMNFEDMNYEIPNYLGDATRTLGARREGTDIAQLIIILFVSLVGIGFLAFLLIPLFRKREGKKSALLEMIKSSIQSLRSGFKSVVDSIKEFFEKLKHKRELKAWSRIKKQGKEALEKVTTRAEQRRQVSKRDRQLQGKVLKAFFRYTKWARKYGLNFRYSFAPLEFSSMIGEKEPELKPDCLEVGKMFERIMYSGHDIKGDYRDAYFDKIKTVTKN
jgi:hypothetical protein